MFWCVRGMGKVFCEFWIPAAQNHLVHLGVPYAPSTQLSPAAEPPYALQAALNGAELHLIICFIYKLLSYPDDIIAADDLLMCDDACTEASCSP